MHRSGKYGYAVNSWPLGGRDGAQPSISLLTIAADGTLTQSGTPLTVGNKPGCVNVVPSGKFAYIAGTDPNTISGYSIDSNSGHLTALTTSPITLSEGPWNTTIDPTGRFLNAATETSILGFALEDASGALTPIAGSPFVGWSNGNNIAIEPTGNFAYVTNPSAADIVYRLDRDTGALSEVKDARIKSGGLNPQRPVFDRTGQFLFVPNMVATWGTTQGTIGAFRIDASTGKLTPVPGSPFAAGEIPKDAAVDVDGMGKYLYVTDGSSFVRVYEIDTTQGSLRYVDRIASRSGVSSVSVVSGSAPVDYAPTMAWVLNQGGARSRPSPLIPTLAVKSVAAGGASLAVEQSCAWAYVANPVLDRLDTFGVDITGALTDFYNFNLPGRSPSLVLADTSGTGVYLTNFASSSISAFHHYLPNQINPFSDAGSNVGLIPAGAAPRVMAVDPNNEYLFVANTGNGTVSRYELAPGFGYPTQVVWLGSPSPFAPDVKAMVMEPTGKYLYATSGNQVLGFVIDYFNSGLPTAIADFPAITLNTPAALVTAFSGNHLYVADAGEVHVFTIARQPAS